MKRKVSYLHLKLLMTVIQKEKKDIVEFFFSSFFFHVGNRIYIRFFMVQREAGHHRVNLGKQSSTFGMRGPEKAGENLKINFITPDQSPCCYFM